MSWQQEVYQRLRADPEKWYRSGELFEEFRTAIPGHIAMRYAIPHCGGEPCSGDRARWLYFTHNLRAIGVEHQRTCKNIWGYDDPIRLRYLTGQQCGKCGGPVIKAGWTARTAVTCLRCEPAVPDESTVYVERPPAPPPTPSPPSPPAPIEYVTPEQLKWRKQRGVVTVVDDRQPQKTLIVHTYRRTLARELKPILNVSINRIERELARRNNNLEAVLALHGMTVKQLPAAFVQRVAFRDFRERIAGAANGFWERIMGR